jgi:hypothetical protein
MPASSDKEHMQNIVPFLFWESSGGNVVNLKNAPKEAVWLTGPAGAAVPCPAQMSMIGFASWLGSLRRLGWRFFVSGLVCPDQRQIPVKAF